MEKTSAFLQSEAIYLDEKEPTLCHYKGMEMPSKGTSRLFVFKEDKWLRRVAINFSEDAVELDETYDSTNIKILLKKNGCGNLKLSTQADNRMVETEIVLQECKVLTEGQNIKIKYAMTDEKNKIIFARVRIEIGIGGPHFDN